MAEDHYESGKSVRNLVELCIFCGSKDPLDKIITEKAEELAKEMVKRKMNLVYGGGNVGLMGVVARTVDAGGCKVTGIIPVSLAPREVSGKMIGTPIVVKDMHVRKLTMYRTAQAFIGTRKRDISLFFFLNDSKALPGGFGTMEELLEVITWAQLGIHSKPIGILNVNGYWDPLLQLVDNAVKQGFIREDLAKGILVVSGDPIELLDKLEKHCPPVSEIKWLTEDQI